ncbi:unnamed protein product [Brassicogethes aeneus]|uniref:Uncharacterized protein n=1 Tax=Brassicogethes aeneus TaxID=1431903 RepID=A0A9P0AYL6_BRAAE|nr:unnamed protein product [Brassicogethes aeneus]
MKFFSCLLLVALFCLAFSKPQDKYTTKYDNIDLDEILKSDRLLRNYINCLMETGKCTPDGLELKKVLPGALQNDCEKCSDKQKEGAKKVLKYLVKNKREWFDEVSSKYDTDGLYKKRYQEEYAHEGIVF